jgi:hypothetical protein
VEQDEETVGAAVDDPVVLFATVAAELAERPILLALQGRLVRVGQVRAGIAEVVEQTDLPVHALLAGRAEL